VDKGDDMSTILIIGGTWDNAYGKSSKILNSIYETVTKDHSITDEYVVSCYNGGSYRELRDLAIFDEFKDLADIIFWAADIPNVLDKIDIKGWYPKSIVITTKRNTEDKYNFQDIVAHGLSKKSNLMIEIQKDNSRYVGRLIDPLGNQWFPTDRPFTDDFGALAIQSIKRAIKLSKITRQATIQSPETPESLYDMIEADCVSEHQKLELYDFFDMVKESADIFHKLIEPGEYIERFLGNASFRCTRGFPSVKLPDGRIYVSRRNVDKRYIGIDTFVQVGWNKETDKVWYRGKDKPSVDTAVQLRLYDVLKDVNYMLHSHVYVKDAPFTDRMIPCGGLEEVGEILNVYHSDNLPGAVNLIGHGSIVFMVDPSDIDEFVFEKRPMPEIHIDGQKA
jgi:hypothetical protein